MSRLARGPVLTAAAAGTTLVVGTGAALAVTAWPAPGPAAGQGRGPGQTHEAADLQSPPVGEGVASPTATSAHGRPSAPAHGPRHAKPASRARPRKPVPPVYLNPLRDISGLMAQRVDMGADFAGTGPVYAIGDAVITNATGSTPGWPGGGWITYRLTSGPAAGLQVFVAEDVRPTVQVGEKVTSSTVIAQMHDFGDGIETGWAMPDGSSAESQLAVAGGVSGGGPFPTKVGLNFDGLLVALGVPAGYYYGQAGYGLLPAGYPVSWDLRAR